MDHPPKLTREEERELIKAAQAGDDDAFAQLHSRFVEYATLRASMKIPAREREEARSIATSAIVRAVRAFDLERSRLARFSMILDFLILNEVTKWWRKCGPRAQEIPISSLPGDEDAPPEAVDDAARKPEDLERGAEGPTYRALHAAIAALPERQQKIVRMRFFRGATFCEIREQEFKGISRQAVHLAYMRAMEQLRKRLAGTGIREELFR